MGTFLTRGSKPPEMVHVNNLKHATIFRGEELIVADPTAISMTIKRMCGCVTKFRGAIQAKWCSRAHTLQTGDRVIAINVDELGGVLAQAKRDCRYFLFDQVVITKCPKA